jgi:hypothetical protein
MVVTAALIPKLIVIKLFAKKMKEQTTQQYYQSGIARGAINVQLRITPPD